MIVGAELYIAEQTMNGRTQERRQHALLRHLADQATAQRTGWLAEQRRRVLQNVGRRLVLLGQRLQQTSQQLQLSAGDLAR